jgi:CHAT domain-containing protein
MAALHDGKQYLVENYRNVLFTKQSFLWLTKENKPTWQALGLGVSDKRENFEPLPGVKTELETIVREPNRSTGILEGVIELNDAFKKQTFFNSVEEGKYPVVHIASHYSFNPARQEASFLLLGDGRLTFNELNDSKNLFGTVDLLTLSACDTGISGNGKEAEGFAYLAQSLGAKSVIASLWKVSDAATPELMIRFYKLRVAHPEMTKGEAFRQAQLQLLNGDTGGQNVKEPTGRMPPRSEVVGTNVGKSALSLYDKTGKPPFAHPHYWSSFVLIGNWR